MSVESLIALVAALGVGGAAGVVLRSEHESAEARRAQMIKVAEEFLIAVQGAITAIREAERAQLALFRRPDEGDEPQGAAKGAADALSNVNRANYSAHVVIPRFNLIFPSRAAPLKGVEGNDPTPAHAVVRGLADLRTALLLRVANPTVNQEALNDEWERFFRGHTAFIDYANEAIWHRWYDPVTSFVHRIAGWPRRIAHTAQTRVIPRRQRQA
jgi:hypothetical protein